MGCFYGILVFKLTLNRNLIKQMDVFTIHLEYNRLLIPFLNMAIHVNYLLETRNSKDS